MGAQRSDSSGANQAEYEPAVLESVGHGKYPWSETALNQM